MEVVGGMNSWASCSPFQTEMVVVGNISIKMQRRGSPSQLRNIGLGSLTTLRTDLVAHPHHLLSCHPLWPCLGRGETSQ